MPFSKSGRRNIPDDDGERRTIFGKKGLKRCDHSCLFSATTPEFNEEIARPHNVIKAFDDNPDTGVVKLDERCRTSRIFERPSKSSRQPGAGAPTRR
jgi:hypothetical protein